MMVKMQCANNNSNNMHHFHHVFTLLHIKVDESATNASPLLKVLPNLPTMYTQILS